MHGCLFHYYLYNNTYTCNKNYHYYFMVFNIHYTLYLYIYLVNSNVCVLMFEMNKILLKIHAFFFKKNKFQ